MAANMEWRRRNSGHLHTGSVEVSNGTGKPILYAHPQDQAGEVWSPAAWWHYTQNDAADDTVDGKSIVMEVLGGVSFDTYRQLFNRWKNASSVFHGLARLTLWIARQSSPAEVFGAPLASNLQASGELAYDAYLKFEPPATTPQTLDIRVVAHVEGVMFVSDGATGTGAVSTTVVAFNQSGEVGHVTALGKFGDPNGQKFDQTFDYAVTVQPGKEIKVASAEVGLGFNISNGNADFLSTNSAEIVV